MFSKAKRFDALGPVKTENKVPHKQDNEKQKLPSKVPPVSSKSNQCVPVPGRPNTDAQSQCSSVPSTKSFVTPKPLKVTKAPSSVKKPMSCTKNKIEAKTRDEIIKAQEVEIRNKDHTISEYNKQIEELKNKISCLQTQIKKISMNGNDLYNLDTKFSKLVLNDKKLQLKNKPIENEHDKGAAITNDLKNKISVLEKQCEKLEQEVCSKQLELSSLEEVIIIRDSLCKDLQNKLTDVESCLEETRQRLEMVNGHHALALEANESIRKEYKSELETLKLKLEEEKEVIISKCKAEQENVKAKYNASIESIKHQMTKEKYDVVQELQQQLITKDLEMKAKLEQIDEATSEKLKLCEIQFEERSRSIQEHCSQQLKTIQYLEQEAKELKYKISLTEEKNSTLQREISNLRNENDLLCVEKCNLTKEIWELKEESKKKVIDFENEINKLTVEIDKVMKEKNKFEMSLSVTRDIVQVLTMRLRESDNELEHLEGKVQTLTNSKEILENELATYKNNLNRSVMECNEYKEALVNILKSKAALAKEHTRIMEHNVTLIESLQNVEKEAYLELGSIKNELIEDVELLKKESNSQIQMLREEVEKKRMLCELATEHAGQATVAAEQSRVLLAQAAAEIARLEAENQCFQQQIQDQQSLVVELSLLRQENEEVAMTLAKQSSIIDKMKKEMGQSQPKPKSPSLLRKTHKIGKENMQTALSPLRERNH